MQCAVYNALSSAQCSVWTLHRVESSNLLWRVAIHCALCNAQYALCTVHCAEWRVDTNSGRREMDWTLDTLAIKLRDEHDDHDHGGDDHGDDHGDGGDGDGGDGDGGDGGDEDVAECFK